MTYWNDSRWDYLWDSLSIPKAVVLWQEWISKEESTLHFRGEALLLDTEELDYHLEMWEFS